MGRQQPRIVFESGLADEECEAGERVPNGNNEEIIRQECGERQGKRNEGKAAIECRGDDAGSCHPSAGVETPQTTPAVRIPAVVMAPSTPRVKPVEQFRTKQPITLPWRTNQP